MNAEEVLAIVLREMTAYGYGWRNDWSDFDGRQLRDQLNDIKEWANKAVGVDATDYTEGTKFKEESGSY